MSDVTLELQHIFLRSQLKLDSDDKTECSEDRVSVKAKELVLHRSN